MSRATLDGLRNAVSWFEWLGFHMAFRNVDMRAANVGSYSLKLASAGCGESGDKVVQVLVQHMETPILPLHESVSINSFQFTD